MAPTYLAHTLALEDGVLFHDHKNRPQPAKLPLAPLFDTHAHLTVFRDTTPAVALARAELAGVRAMVVPLDPSEDALDVPATLAELDQARSEVDSIELDYANRGYELPSWPSYPGLPRLADNVYYLAGVHPYGARLFADDPAVKARLEELLACSRCLGVGEIGLDLGPYNELGLDVQLAAFSYQLNLAIERNLPVELHIRDPKDPADHTAHDAAFQLLQKTGIPGAGCVLHCFTEGPEIVDQYASIGCHITFGGALTFAKSDAIRAAAQRVPAAQLLLETDCPYMAPAPLRGIECEPALISFTAATMASLLDADPQDTYSQLWDNASALFGLM